VFAFLAAVAAALGFLLNGLAAHTNTWFSPLSLGLLSLALLALHLSGANSWLPRR
jgi:hypothetical protein